MAELWTVDRIRADGDWRHAFHEAEFGGFGGTGDEGPVGILAILEEVIAAVEGENDGDNWVALVKLTDGRYAKVFAGCDYTGWDCRASGNVEFYGTLDELLSPNTLTVQEVYRLGLDDRIWVDDTERTLARASREGDRVAAMALADKIQERCGK